MPRKSQHKPIEYLSVEEIIILHASVIRDAEVQVSPVILSEDRIVSALNRPAAAAYYEQADFHRQAATLLWGIAKAHGFLDGNKRVALVAMRTFLAINGFDLIAPKEETERLIVDIAENIVDVEATDAWLREYVRASTKPA